MFAIRHESHSVCVFIPLCDPVKLAAPQATSVITIGLDDVTACHISQYVGAKIIKKPLKIKD